MSAEEKQLDQQPENTAAQQEHKSVWKVFIQPAFLIIFISNIVFAISFNIINAGIVVHFTEDYGINAAIVGTVVSMFSFFALLVKPISSPIIDRVNRKHLMVIVTIGYGLGTLGLAFANDVTTLYVWQAIRGVGFGFMMALYAIVLADVVGKADYGVATGLFMMGPVIGSSVVAPFALPVADIIGYTGLFSVSAILGIINGALIAVMPYKRPNPKPTEAEKKGEKKKLKFSDFLDVPSLPYMLIAGISNLAIYGQGATILLAFGRADLAIANVGICVTIHNVIMYVTRPVFGRIIDTKGARYGLIPGFIAIGIANLITAASTDIWGLVIAAVIYGIGGGGLIGSRTLAIKGAPDERTGVAANTYLIGTDIGNTLGPIVFTSLAVAFGGMYRNAYVALGVVALVAIVIWILFMKHLLKRHPENKMGW